MSYSLDPAGSINAITIVLALAIVAVLALAYLTSSTPDYHPSKFRSQSIRSKTRMLDGSAIVRHPLVPTCSAPLLTKFPSGAATAYSMFWGAVEKHVDKKYLAHRVASSWGWQTFGEIGARAKAFGGGLSQIVGLEPGAGADIPGAKQMLGLYLQGSPEWIIADFACVTYSLVSVPLYDTFDAPSLKHIINQTEMTAILTSSRNIGKVLDVSGECPTLRNVIVADLDDIPINLVERAAASNIKILTYKQIEVAGREKPKEPVPPTPENVFTICFTSGTTGLPKGAMITHQNIAAGGAGMCATLPEGYRLTDTDRHLSYLPLSHMFERITFHTLTALGAECGFYCGNITKLFDDLASFQPTLFPTVPRLLTRLFDKTNGAIAASNFFKQSLFDLAYAAKKRMLQNGRVTKQSVWDSLIFKRIQAHIGGKVKLVLTGAAPISPDVLEFVRIVLGCQVLEGYGQTESSAAGFVTTVGDYQFPYGSHVGVPFPSAEFKLVDVPSMNYLATDEPNPRGEICIRGPLVMKGYYKEPKLTSEAIDLEGWLHTGDVGEILPNGTLKITDRVKNIFKLSQGEYVAPDKIEQRIKPAFAQQVYVYGDSLQSSLVAIVVPDPEPFLAWAKAQHAFGGRTLEDACNDSHIVRAVLLNMAREGKKAGLHAFEIPRAVFLDPTPMSVENGMLTPTFKTKRNVARDHYRPQIDRMYESIGA